MILALVASGLTLIFGIMDVVNFAHGDLVMLGGFVGATTIAATGNFWVALLAAAVVIAVFGAALQVTTLRPLLGPRPAHDDPGDLRHVARAPEVRAVAVGPVGPQAPGADHRPVRRSSTSQYPWYRDRHRRAGRRPSSARSGSSSSTASTASGSAPRPRTGSWRRPWASPCPSCTPRCSRIGAAMAAASGVLFGPLGGVTQTMGADFTLRAFIVVVVGGMGNLGRLDPGVDLHQPAGGLRLARS